jgi:hypothetical protein
LSVALFCPNNYIIFRNIAASEGRLSIRESLRIFSNVETYLKKMPDSSFELLCIRAAQGSMVFEAEHSCGNTMMGFASMFLAKQHTTHIQLNSLINGPPLTCLLCNPNILLHSLHTSRSVSVLRDLTAETKYFQWTKTVSRFASMYGYSSIQSKLLESDFPENLPRILFCSLAWISPSGWINPNITTDGDSMNFRDHKFTIIKHSNDRYQVVQGYIKSAHDRKSFRSGDLRTESFIGYDARSWMLSGNDYCSSDGFDRTSMIEFLSHLKAFAEGSTFDPRSYEHMFGVHVDAHRWLGDFQPNTATADSDGAGDDEQLSEALGYECYQHIPSLYHRELSDNHIVGYGTRDMAHAMEEFLQL